jgi:catechol 2,3-dioxygenase-like lactoylglutathione lyase family enzyme
MLGNADIVAIVPVKDLEKGKKFYVDTLGLEIVKERPGGIVMKSGSTQVLVYKTGFAGTNQATTAAWTVKDVDGVAKDLTAKGIKLEHYDLPGASREGDVHILGDLRAIWFKDPDGNILSVGNDLG